MGVFAFAGGAGTAAGFATGATFITGGGVGAALATGFAIGFATGLTGGSNGTSVCSIGSKPSNGSGPSSNGLISSGAASGSRSSSKSSCGGSIASTSASAVGAAVARGVSAAPNVVSTATCRIHQAGGTSSSLLGKWAATSARNRVRQSASMLGIVERTSFSNTSCTRPGASSAPCTARRRSRWASRVEAKRQRWGISPLWVSRGCSRVSDTKGTGGWVS